MFSKIIQKLRTVESVDELIGEVDLLLASLYEGGEHGFSSVLKSGVRAWLSQSIISEVGKTGISFEDYLKLLKEKLENLEKVNLVLAFEPSDTNLDVFIEVLRGVINKEIVLEIEVDKNIMGGAVVSFRGRYKDFSLLRIFDQNSTEVDLEIKNVLGIRSLNS